MKKTHKIVLMIFLCVVSMIPTVVSQSNDQGISIQITTEKSEYWGGEEIKGDIKVINRDSIIHEDIIITIKSTLIEDKSLQISLAPGEEYPLEPFIVEAPQTATSKEETIEVTVTFKNGEDDIEKKEIKKLLILRNTQADTAIDIKYKTREFDGATATISTIIKLVEEVTGQIEELELEILLAGSDYSITLTPNEIKKLETEKEIIKEITLVVKNDVEKVGVTTDLMYTVNKQRFSKILSQEVKLTENEEDIKVELIKKRDNEEVKIQGRKEHTVKRIVMVILGLIFCALFALSFQKFLKAQRTKSHRTKKVKEIQKGKPEEEKHNKDAFLEKIKGTVVLVQTPKPADGHNKLEEYIKYWKEKERSEEKIKEALVKEGWLEDVIDVYLNM